MTDTTDYVPFGKEWEKEIMQMRKADIVELYKKACQLNQLKELQTKHEFYTKLNDKLNLILNSELDLEDYAEEVFTKMEMLDREILNLE